MFNNIGNKVKGLAVFIAVIGIISSIISGIALISSKLTAVGLVVLFAGSLVSWISSWVVYAVGDTNEKVTAMYENSFDEPNPVPSPAPRPEPKPKPKPKPRPEPEPDTDPDEYVDIVCPNRECGMTLSFMKSELSSGELYCPYCGEKIKKA